MRLIYPEQRQLSIRETGQLPRAPLPEIPPPATVSEPAPKLAPTELSLDEAIHIALANCQVVRILSGVTATASGQTIYDAAISNTAIDDARSVFDPTLTVKNSWNRIDTPAAIFDPTSPIGVRIPDASTDQYHISAIFSKKTMLGGTLSLDTEFTHTRFPANAFSNVLGLSASAPVNPLDQSSVALSYTQPLLRGAGIQANVAPIVIARINTEISFFQYRDSVQELVRGVAEAYWAVLFARTDVWAKKQQVELLQFTYDRAEARKRAGFGSEGEVAQAKTSLYNFKAALVGAEANLLQREAALRNILRLSPTGPPLELTSPPATNRVEPRWHELLALAGERRPDLIQLKLTLEADQQSLVVANNLARTQVDLTGLYQWNGLSGLTPSGLRIQTSAGEFANWTLGVNVSVPLGMRQDRARLRKAELILVRDRANLDQGIHNAVHTLAGSVRNLSQYFEQYQAYKVARAAARENIRQQFAEYGAGRPGAGGAFYLNVLQAISDWGNAVSSEAQSLAQYNTELASLERQTGTILETHGVRFLEERYRSIGPLGRCLEPRDYPAAVPPGPNMPVYPAGAEPVEKVLDRDRPSLPRPKAGAPPAELGPLEELPAPRPFLMQPVAPGKQN
jgi:outer membrane protein TolC